MNVRTKTIAAGIAGAALTLGAAGAAVALTNDPADATVAQAPVAEPTSTLRIVHGVGVKVPDDWGLFFLDQDGALDARGATLTDLGELAPAVTEQLKAAEDSSYMLVDLDTLEADGASDGATSMLVTATKTGKYPLAESTKGLRDWMNGLFKKGETTPALKFDTKKAPAAYVEHVADENSDFVIRDYVMQFEDQAVTVQLATDTDDPAPDLQAAENILKTINIK